MLIDTKSLTDLLHYQLNKWQEQIPNINTNEDSMVYMDALPMAQLAYLIQLDAITLHNNAFIAFATGDELTNLGKDRGLERKVAEYAYGEVTFSRGVKANDDYVIAEQTEVSTQAGGNGFTINYRTTEESWLYGIVNAPTKPTLNSSTTGGLIVDGAYRYKISCVSKDNKETNPSDYEEIIISGTLGTNVINLNWLAVDKADRYRVYIAKDSFDFKLIGETASPVYTDILGYTTSVEVPKIENETGNTEVTVPIKCVRTGLIGNVAPKTVILFVNKPDGIDFVENRLPIDNGSNDEDDETYRARLQEFLSANTGKITKTGYTQTAMSVGGVKNVILVQPYPNDYRRNEIDVYITADTLDGVASDGLIEAVQTELDKDENRAVCDKITVKRPNLQPVDVSIIVVSYDSENYTQSYVEQNIRENLQAFFPTVDVGGWIVVKDIENIIHDTIGVKDFILQSPNLNIQLLPTDMAIAGSISVLFN